MYSCFLKSCWQNNLWQDCSYKITCRTSVGQQLADSPPTVRQTNVADSWPTIHWQSANCWLTTKQQLFRRQSATCWPTNYRLGWQTTYCRPTETDKWFGTLLHITRNLIKGTLGNVIGKSFITMVITVYFHHVWLVLSVYKVYKWADQNCID